MGDRRTEVSGPYQLFMLVLSVGVLVGLAAVTFLDVDEDTRTILRYADHAVCVVFFLDFLRSLICAENRGRYLVRWGWLDLLSSVPAVDFLRLGRAGRILRILRMLRGVRATREVVRFLFPRQVGSAFWTAAALSVLLVVVGSIAVTRFESGHGGTIRSGGDALWWAFVTVTTVGYGDVYPTTAGGRIIAALLMLSGISIFGTFTAYVGSWFESPRQPTDGREELLQLTQEVRQLRAEFEERRSSPPPG